MNKAHLSSKSVRKIILHAQLLDGGTELSEGKEGIAQTINALGYVQIDTISVIRRSHHHTLWTRRNDYDDKMLHDLQANDRLIFEYWGHAMSYLPMSDYRYFLPRMRNFLNPSSKWTRQQMEKYDHLTQSILERIRNEGPLSSKDFSSSTGKKGGTWWDWKPAKAALELLFWRGELMVTERQNFKKVYDLTERVIPEDVNTIMPNSDELGQFLVRRALSAFGVANEKEIQKYLQPGAARDSDLQAVGKDVILKTLNNFLESKEVLHVIIEENQNEVYYALPDVLENANRSENKLPHVFFLSPFDNLVIQRERVKRLFGFQYSLECYVPASKRRFGYFVLPILWGDTFVGRLDPKADRKNKALIIRNLVFEPDFDSFERFIPQFVKKLIEFAHFNRCEKIVFQEISPNKIKANLEYFVKNALTGQQNDG